MGKRDLKLGVKTVRHGAWHIVLYSNSVRNTAANLRLTCLSGACSRGYLFLVRLTEIYKCGVKTTRHNAQDIVSDSNSVRNGGTCG